MSPALSTSTNCVTRGEPTSPTFSMVCTATASQAATSNTFRPHASAQTSAAAGQSSSSSGSGTSSTAYIQTCRARRGGSCRTNLKDAWQRKAEAQQPHAQHTQQHSQPLSPQADSPCGPSCSTLPTIALDTTTDQQQQPGSCKVDELELALTGWLWDQEEGWPLAGAAPQDPDLARLSSCWMQEDAAAQRMHAQQPLDACLPQLVSLTESAGQLAEALDHIFADCPSLPSAAVLSCAAAAAAAGPSLSPSHSGSLPPAACPLPQLKTDLDLDPQLLQDLDIPTPPLSCHRHASDNSADQLPHLGELLGRDDGTDVDMEVDPGLQRRWSEQTSAGMRADFIQRWAALAVEGRTTPDLKRRWSELPSEAVAAGAAAAAAASASASASAESCKVPRVCLDLRPAVAASSAPPSSSKPGKALVGRALPPLMASLKQQLQQQQQQRQQQQQQQQGSRAAKAAVPASASAPASCELPAVRTTASQRAAAAASPSAPPTQAPAAQPPLHSSHAATLQSLLEWHALSHRVVSAAGAPNQDCAWALLSDSDLQRFLAKTRPTQLELGGGRQQMIDSIKQTVQLARASSR